jgi:N-acetylglutamate synthase-like GNAT family acetyltransferase
MTISKTELDQASPSPGPPTFIRARAEKLASINDLIARSKAHWPWPEDYLVRSLSLLKVTPQYLSKAVSFEILDSDRKLVGFLSVEERDTSSGLLDHLWIDPSRIGKGLGSLACDHAFGVARQEGWTALFVLPDPPSAKFYERKGFRDTGERVPSRVQGGPTFSLYCVAL